MLNDYHKNFLKQVADIKFIEKNANLNEQYLIKEIKKCGINNPYLDYDIASLLIERTKCTFPSKEYIIELANYAVFCFKKGDSVEISRLYWIIKCKV